MWKDADSGSMKYGFTLTLEPPEIVLQSLAGMFYSFT